MSLKKLLKDQSREINLNYFKRCTDAVRFTEIAWLDNFKIFINLVNRARKEGFTSFLALLIIKSKLHKSS